ncbi:aldehyde dehydrogenase family 1 member A3-like protein [Anopheles sinensis]|uniref:Aldehyde dehydrogenase family 1 member A3-like protein n=1 Tax=Anopheles sinensis TaxID=74873 RepID=A0A084VHB6_ANOSI|nr:aldehyde dehydrogenase family 1 member A3-like protein [Anopheles sinensis]
MAYARFVLIHIRNQWHSFDHHHHFPTASSSSSETSYDKPHGNDDPVEKATCRLRIRPVLLDTGSASVPGRLGKGESRMAGCSPDRILEHLFAHIPQAHLMNDGFGETVKWEER